eukprot:9978195-Alexandrium_andersonii.AAC.1
MIHAYKVVQDLFHVRNLDDATSTLDCLRGALAILCCAQTRHCQPELQNFWGRCSTSRRSVASWRTGGIWMRADENEDPAFVLQHTFGTDVESGDPRLEEAGVPIFP